MPNVIIGNIDPVDAALFAASGAATPEILPLPKLSGFFEKVLASPRTLTMLGLHQLPVGCQQRSPKLIRVR